MASSGGLHFPSPDMAEAGDMVYDVYGSDDDVYGHHHHDDADHGGGNTHQGGSSLSRLSMCTSSMYSINGDDDDDHVFDGTRISMSRLSIESCFDADDDEEEEQPKKERRVLDLDMIISSSDSDKDQPGEGGCYSLPATPRRGRSSQFVGGLMSRRLMGAKEYASENEAQMGFAREVGSTRKLRRRRRGGGSGDYKKGSEGRRVEEYEKGNSGFSGESDQGGGGGGGGGLVVITRPKGGKRSLCMDLEEVKACKDLGFELEHERMLEVPASRVSFSGSTLDTSSGGNSPIANWRISSPGDDPRDVKARLKVWAQAVAIASTSRHGGI